MDNIFSSLQDSSDPNKSVSENLTSQVPSYLLAADNHNIGNSLGGSWFDPATWETKFDNAGRFLAVSVLSGADSIYNSGATVANWFGAEAELLDTKKVATQLFDDDMGKYYDKNRDAADMFGFVVSSFIPGLGGVKFLNVGQKVLKGAIETGAIGGNLAKATGLLVPKAEAYALKSSQEILGSTVSFNRMNQYTLKALRDGVTQNVLEAAAFETAVQATMFKSPLLDHQDGYDIAKNIAFGGLVGGAIGGAFSAAKTFGTIKREVLAGNPEIKEFTSRATIAEATPLSQRVIIMSEDADTAITPAAYETLNPGSQLERNTKLYNSKQERILNDRRGTIHAMGQGGDTELTNLVADSITDLGHQQIFNNFVHMEELGSLSTKLSAERALNKAIKNIDVEATSGIEIRYISLLGENAGTVADTKPIVTSIADNVAVNSKISRQDAVLAEVRGYKFKPDDGWRASDLLKVDAHTEAEARYIWASKVLKEIKPNATISHDDIPLLERAWKDQRFDLSVKYADGSIRPMNNAKDLMDHIVETKQEVASKLLESHVLKGSTQIEVSTPEIAKIVNMKESALTGSVDKLNTDDYFATQTANRVYKEFLVSKGLKNATSEIQDIAFLPTVAKASYKTTPFTDVDGNIIDGLVWAKQKQKLYQDAADRTFAAGAGDIAENAPDVTKALLNDADVYGGGAGLFTSANGRYGSFSSAMQQVGSNVTRPLKERFRKITADTLESPLVRLGNKQEAAIEFDVINNKIASTTEHYVPDLEGVTGEPYAMVSKKILEYKTAIAEGKNPIPPTLQKGAPEFIPVKNQETYDAITAHIQRDSDRTNRMMEINSVLGHADEKDVGIFRPVRPSTIDYPHIAFVKDEKVTGAGHTTMIHAASERELQAMIDKVPLDQGYKVYLKGQAEDFYKAQGEYNYARTLHENYMDSSLKSNGINSQFFTKTDPQKIVDGILQQHLRADDVLATELVRMKYQPAFDWLEDQGKAYSQIESSRYGNALANAEKYGKNPYTDQTKTALDISRISEYPLLHSANRLLDSAVSKVVGDVKKVFQEAKSPQDLDKINEMLQAAGINNAYKDSATVLLANHTAPKAELSKFVRSANGILSRFTLGLDPLNALNNAIGANILRGTELKQITDAIAAGDSTLAGKLASVGKINLPGTSDQILSPTKLLGNSLRNWANDDGTLLAKYKSEGLIKDALQQFKSIQDDFTLRGTESVSELNGRISSAFGKAKKLAEDVGERGQVLTGNRYAEEFNRFMSADVMRQITDLGEQSGLLTAVESKAYRNTFVNRVEGNITASQRPLIFQGPIGQAVGLFQSYQFNLMQQLFRYVGEGTSKDAAMLLGLQSTMYGINGAPGFNFINSHIIGNFSGNKNHTDLYDATYGIAGKTAGDFLMYGIPSNIIQTNIYSRGDINPRQVTIIPTQLSDVPIISAYTKFFSNLYETTHKIGTGANVWESLLQGAEHNGISRPLAGLSQTLQATTGNGNVFSTTTKGSLLYSNDLLSFATLSRLAGGRPLDEAVVNDGVYRITSYEAAQKKQKDALAEAVKASMIQGQSPGSDSIAKFSEEYVAAGGKSMQFNKWMMREYVAANTSRADKIRAQLESPFANKMQILMGGRDSNEPIP